MASTRYDRKPEETEWFRGHKKPVHVGVYRRVGIWFHQFQGENLSADGYSFWDGKQWSVSSRTPKTAYKNRRMSSGYQPDKHAGALFDWLGLKEKPQC